MQAVQQLIALIGRLLISLLFLLAALNKLLDWQGAEQLLVNALCDLVGYVHGNEGLQKLIQMMIPWASVLLTVGFALEALGGLLLFFGIKLRFAAFLLVIFLIPATLIFHHFWFLQGADRQLQMTFFVKNMGILGGLLVLLSHGSGKCSAPPAAP